MVNAFSADPNALINAAAAKLEAEALVQPPAWTAYAKTGAHKQHRPEQKNWWYVRCAAVLRSVYKLGPIGTNKLTTKFGGRKNRGYKPEMHYDGSGSVARKALQQLEAAGLVTQVQKGVHKGRVVTPKGKSFLDKLAITVAKQ